MGAHASSFSKASSSASVYPFAESCGAISFARIASLLQVVHSPPSLTIHCFAKIRAGGAPVRLPTARLNSLCGNKAFFVFLDSLEVVLKDMVVLLT